MVPDGLRYSKDHEWVRLEGDEGVVGITDHAQKELGDIVYLDLPEIGATLRVGEEFGTVESVKAVSEMYAPVSGEVTQVNKALTQNADDSATVNKDPYGEGWLIRVRLSDPSEVETLLSRDAYESYLKEAAD